MKVLRIIPSLDAADGGPTTAAIGMSTALARAGASVTQIATVAAAGGASAHREEFDEKGVEYHLFPRSLPGSYKYSRALGSWVRRHTREYDVVHVEALFSYTTIPGCRAAFHDGVPYVLGPLGSLNEWSQRHRSWKKRPYLALIERRHLQRATALHANSRSEAEALTKAGYGDKTHVIPLGVDIPVLTASRPRGEAMHVVFLSRLHPIKGLPLLMKAIAGARHAGVAMRLTIAGSGEEAYERELRALVNALDIEAHVSFVGHVTGPAKDALFASADLFALTSYQESFGLAILEAMAHGVPVLVTDRGGIVDDVRSARAGVVVGVNVEEIQSSLVALARDPERRRTLGVAARELATARYSWDRTASGLLALYESIVASRAPARALHVAATA